MNINMMQLMKSNIEGRSQVYDILRRIFLVVPSLDMLKSLIEQTKSQDEKVDFLFPEEEAFFTYLRNLDLNHLEQFQKELTWEYNRLFVGPYHLPTPPYESVYRSSEGLMMQDFTIQVRKKYLAAGLQVVGLNQNPDDHIGLELEFMYYLCAKALEIFKTDKPFGQKEISELRSILLQQQTFLEDHLLQWVPIFCQDIVGQTRQLFFARAAEFMSGYLEFEKQTIKEALDLLNDY